MGFAESDDEDGLESSHSFSISPGITGSVIFINVSKGQLKSHPVR
jgi:hypothetical protein